MQQTGLDQRLELHADGTFSLQHKDDKTSNDDNDDNNHCRIWTFYDKDERKHYLQVQKGTLVGRYLLQDNQKPAWQDDSSKTSLPEKIAHAVDDMVLKIQTAEHWLGLAARRQKLKESNRQCEN